MCEFTVKILNMEQIAKRVYKIETERPAEYPFIPGQYTNISLNDGTIEGRTKSYSFTGLINSNRLEFITKECKEDYLLGKRISMLKQEDRLKITQPLGNIRYKGTGIFIAGGIGVTPFIAILRDLKRKGDQAGNMLIYSNHTVNDMILDYEFNNILGNDYIKIFTQERYKKYYYGRIDKEFIRMSIVDFARYFYVSGSNEFVENIINILRNYGAEPDTIIYEKKALIPKAQHILK